MPVYDMVLLIRKLDRVHLKEVLKRSANYIFEVGGLLRSMENLGLRNLPYVIHSKGKRHIHAHCFVFQLDTGEEDMREISQKFRLDLDVVRASKWLNSRTVMDFHVEKETPQCTLYQDLLPPPYRENVIALQEASKVKKKHTHKNYDDTDFSIY